MFRFSWLWITLAAISLNAIPALADPVPDIGDALGLSPFLDWKTIETEHFRVTFPVEIKDIAMKSANFLEEAHSILSKRLFWEARYKANILVVNNTDMTNGLTTPVLRFGIILQVGPPDNWFTTNYYDDWLRLLCFHEYTHFLNMDNTRYLWSALRILFGDVLLPNSVWPSWMLEGLAVYMESRYTHSGRGRSTFYDMVIRSAVEENVLDDSKFITLDKINGTNPYYPGGETAYLFGFSLMNQVAHQSSEGHTADGDSLMKDSEDALGIMSDRSAGRVPFFINGNLENITSKSWHQFWDQWVEDEKKRAAESLAKIHSQPVSKVERIATKGYQTNGPAFSPDGKWLAYTQDNSDRRMGLYLKNLETGETERLIDKLEGGTIAFTPDSKSILYSAAHKITYYYIYSDLAVYHIDSHSYEWLTNRLRAKDPDISRDGQWVTFTINENMSNHLALAKLQIADGKLTLGKPEIIYRVNSLDRVSTPKFSLDANRIYFSLHQNGHVGEDLMEFDRITGKVFSLIVNGHFNHYPAIGLKGDVYFVSDMSGVDNLYRLNLKDTIAQPELATNLTTGMAFPVFNAKDELYGTVFSYKGWDVAKIQMLENPIQAEAVTLTAISAPIEDSLSENHAKDTQYPITDYSVIPSIWPRQWAPIIYAQPGMVYFGGQVLGFDQLDLHRYALAAAYSTLVEKPDLLAVYSNRQLGATLTLLTAYYTTNLMTNPDNSLAAYSRRLRFNPSLSFPFQWTYSSFTPSLSLNVDRTFDYIPGANPTNGDLVSESPYVPSVDLVGVYSNAETSRLAISTEAGRTSTAGYRLYMNGGEQVWKGLVKDVEHFRLSEHMILVPSVKASWVSKMSQIYSSSQVLVTGRFSTVFDGFNPDNLDQISIRGYPNQTYFAREAAIPAVDLRFPLARIFRGWGTNPVFLNNLYGFTFAEAGYFPNSEPGATVLPSAGGGLTLSSDLFVQVPLTISVQYHYGFRTNVGGAGQAFVQVGLSNITF